MPVYDICGLKVYMDPKHETLKKQSEKYLCAQTQDDYDLKISLSDEYIKEKQAQYPHLNDDMVEYIFYGSLFYEKILERDMFFLHSSAIAYENNAYLFSAPSGTGKSTHTSIWLKNFKGAFIINDDKPAIALENGEFFVYGTPFSGKTDTSENVKVPLKAICLLERGEENKIEKCPAAKAVLPILNQTVRPPDKMASLMDLIKKLLEKCQVYNLRCNMEDAAAVLAYNEMRKDF